MVTWNSNTFGPIKRIRENSLMQRQVLPLAGLPFLLLVNDIRQALVFAGFFYIRRGKAKEVDLVEGSRAFAFGWKCFVLFMGPTVYCRPWLANNSQKRKMQDFTSLAPRGWKPRLTKRVHNSINNTKPSLHWCTSEASVLQRTFAEVLEVIKARTYI